LVERQDGALGGPPSGGIQSSPLNFKSVKNGSLFNFS
jgi:hypothetical protein